MSIKQDINKLTDTAGGKTVLNSAVAVGSINKRFGVADFSASDSQSQGQQTAGIASPLTEVSRVTLDVEIFDQFNVWSVIETHIVQLEMTDANLDTVIFNFSNP